MKASFFIVAICILILACTGCEGSEQQRSSLVEAEQHFERVASNDDKQFDDSIAWMLGNYESVRGLLFRYALSGSTDEKWAAIDVIQKKGNEEDAFVSILILNQESDPLVEQQCARIALELLPAQDLIPILTRPGAHLALLKSARNLETGAEEMMTDVLSAMMNQAVASVKSETYQSYLNTILMFKEDSISAGGSETVREAILSALDDCLKTVQGVNLKQRADELAKALTNSR